MRDSTKFTPFRTNEPLSENKANLGLPDSTTNAPLDQASSERGCTTKLALAETSIDNTYVMTLFQELSVEVRCIKAAKTLVPEAIKVRPDYKYATSPSSPSKTHFRPKFQNFSISDRFCSSSDELLDTRNLNTLSQVYELTSNIRAKDDSIPRGLEVR